MVFATRQTCVYCGERATCIDHIRPKSRGGLDIESNRVPCCQICNSSKRATLLNQWDVKRVLYAVSQDARIFMEIIELTGTHGLIPEDMTISQKVNIAARLLNMSPKLNAFKRYIQDQIIAAANGISDIDRYSLREMCDQELIPISYQAIKRARTRAGNNFPPGPTYSVNEIIEWISKTNSPARYRIRKVA